MSNHIRKLGKTMAPYMSLLAPPILSVMLPSGAKPTTEIPTPGVRRLPIGAVEIAIVGMSTAVYLVLSVFAAGFAVVPGITIMYTPEAWLVAASMWFGIWGVLGAYFGTILQEPFFGMGYAVGLVMGIGNMMVGLICGIVLRRMPGFDMSLRNKKSIFMLILLGGVLGPIVEILVCAPVYIYVLQWYTWGFILTFPAFAWWLGDFSVVVTLGVIIMRVLSKYVTRTPLYHKGFIHRETSTE